MHNHLNVLQPNYLQMNPLHGKIFIPRGDQVKLYVIQKGVTETGGTADIDYKNVSMAAHLA